MLALIISLIALALAAYASFVSIKTKKELNEVFNEAEELTPETLEQYVHVESDFFEVKNGSVHLKDEYNGLYVDGFISAGGKSETKED